MKRWRKAWTIVLIAVFTFTSLNLSGCFLSPSKEGSFKLKQATVTPPTISKPGVLRVGIDTSHAPFGGIIEGKIYGIDRDIAAALAEEMGLQLEVIDVKGKDINALLKDGTIDVVMGIQGETAGSFTEVKVGPYLVDGPAIFSVGVSSGSSTFDPEKLIGVKIVAQEGSLSAFIVTEEYGKENIVLFPLLSVAFDELASGTYSYAAADAIVGAYLAVKKENVRCIGLLGDTQGVYMGVTSEKFELANELTKSLRTLRDNGTLGIIISKWIGPQSAQVISSDQAIMSITNPDSSSSGTSDDDGGE